jgi:hypothetical protein
VKKTLADAEFVVVLDFAPAEIRYPSPLGVAGLAVATEFAPS